MDWGNAVAVVSLILSILVFYREYRRKVRSQAEEISAWWVRVDLDKHKVKMQDGKFDTPVDDPKRYRVGMLLQNSSDAPVSNVLVESTALRMKNGKRVKGCDSAVIEVPDITMSVLPQGSYIAMRINPAKDSKERKREWAFPEDEKYFKGSKIRPILNSDQWTVWTLRFVDASGRAWVRDFRRHTLSISWIWHLIHPEDTIVDWSKSIRKKRLNKLY